MKTLKSSKTKAWKQFSLWVRLSAADQDGMVRCITCGTKKHYKEMQAGHFIPGRRNAVLFSEEGVHPQCYSCNMGKGGDWPRYYEWMKGMYGLEIIDQLIFQSRQAVKYTGAEYEDIAKKYKQAVDELE